MLTHKVQTLYDTLAFPISSRIHTLYVHHNPDCTLVMPNALYPSQHFVCLTGDQCETGFPCRQGQIWVKSLVSDCWRKGKVLPPTCISLAWLQWFLSTPAWLWEGNSGIINLLLSLCWQEHWDTESVSDVPEVAVALPTGTGTLCIKTDHSSGFSNEYLTPFAFLLKCVKCALCCCSEFMWLKLNMGMYFRAIWELLLYFKYIDC